MNNVDHEAMNTKLRLWSPSTEAMITPLKKKCSDVKFYERFR